MSECVFLERISLRLACVCEKDLRVFFGSFCLLVFRTFIAACVVVCFEGR